MTPVTIERLAEAHASRQETFDEAIRDAVTQQQASESLGLEENGDSHPRHFG